MDVKSATSAHHAFHASREAAAARLKKDPPVLSQDAGKVEKSLTPTSRAVDAMNAAKAADGPLKGRNVDLVA
jgi:hypothetical protein